MDRRAFLRASLALAAGAIATTTIAACTTSGPTSVTPAPSLSRVPQPAMTPTGAAGRRTLLAYFSRAGENYRYGRTTDLAIGNTQVVAEAIASLVAVDGYRIVETDTYPHSYVATVARNVREEAQNSRPGIANPLPDVSDYDTVLLGSGIWNVQEPMIMRTFVEGVDLSGKTIYPFTTYAMSGLGRVVDNYTRLCPQSTIGEGLAVRGEEVADARSSVEAWLRSIGLL